MGDELLFQLQATGLPTPEREYRFHPTRRWRYDYAWPDMRVAVEIEGGIWVKGRHTRGGGYSSDLEKYNEATRLGWQVYRFTPQQVRRGQALEYIEGILKTDSTITGRRT